MKFPTDRVILSVLKKHDIESPSEDLLYEIRSFLCSVSNTHSFFHFEEGKEVMKDYLKKVKQLEKQIDQDIDNISYVIIQTKKGAPVKFNSYDLGFDVFRKLFIQFGEKPDMSLAGDFKKQVAYFNSARFKFPFKIFSDIPDQDQYFVEIVKDAVKLGRYLFAHHLNKKAKIRRLIMDLIKLQDPELEVSEANEIQTFKIYFNKELTK